MVGRGFPYSVVLKENSLTLLVEQRVGQGVTGCGSSGLVGEGLASKFSWSMCYVHHAL